MALLELQQRYIESEREKAALLAEIRDLEKSKGGPTMGNEQAREEGMGKVKGKVKSKGKERAKGAKARPKPKPKPFASNAKRPSWLNTNSPKLAAKPSKLTTG